MQGWSFLGLGGQRATSFGENIPKKTKMSVNRQFHVKTSKYQNVAELIRCRIIAILLLIHNFTL